MIRHGQSVGKTTLGEISGRKVGRGFNFTRIKLDDTALYRYRLIPVPQSPLNQAYRRQRVNIVRKIFLCQLKFR